jgi:hypothetical protein
VTKAIRIHATDSDDEAHTRHAEIEKILEGLGPAQVKMSLLAGGLPTGWNVIAQAWLAGDKLEPKGPAGDAGQVGWMGGEFDR